MPDTVEAELGAGRWGLPPDDWRHWDRGPDDADGPPAPLAPDRDRAVDARGGPAGTGTGTGVGVGVGAEVEPYDPGGPLPARNGDALRLAGLAAAAELERAGRSLTRAALVDALRGREVRVSTGRASELLRWLRSLTPAERDQQLRQAASSGERAGWGGGR